jgi:L-ascorbate metabolism protein UlaG (beta-lactamase superfamily)
MLRVTYISHSGFLVELEEAYLVFDYYKGTIPEFDPQKTVYVFSSHSHHDHFNFNIFTLQKRENKTYYIFSDDIQVDGFKEVTLVQPNMKITVGDCLITTFRSTDLGVAFLVDYKGTKIYHAGDLNWWHWNGESNDYNEKMKFNYQKEIDKIKDEKIDVAFVTLDPRLEDAYLLGFDHFMRHTNTQTVFPMHFWDKYEIFHKLLSDNVIQEYKDRIICIQEEGEEFCL